MGQLNAAHANMALSLVGAPPAGIQPGDKPSLQTKLALLRGQASARHGFFALQRWVGGVMVHAANRTKSCGLRTACGIDGSDLKCWAGAPNMPTSHGCGVVEQPTPEAGRKEEGQATSQPQHRLHQQQSPCPTAKSLRHQARRHDLHACLVCLLSPLRLWQLCPCHVLCSVPAALHLPYGCWIGLQPFFSS